MTIEDVKKATIDDAKKLLSLAKQYDIDEDVVDLDASADIIADIISDKMKNDGIEAVYNFIKDAAESRSPLAVIDVYDYLRPFEEADLDDLKERLYEEVFSSEDAKVLNAIEEAFAQDYSSEGVRTLDRIGEDFGISTPFTRVTVADELSDDLIIENDPPKTYSVNDFDVDRYLLIEELRKRLSDF